MKAAACAAILALSGCASNPQQLPVGLSICSAVSADGGFGIRAGVENRSTKPISSLVLTAAFYRDFRYRSYQASAKLSQELDPGQKRDITFAVSAQPGQAMRGEAIRCYVTHIGYLDGTSDDAPPVQ